MSTQRMFAAAFVLAFIVVRPVPAQAPFTIPVAAESLATVRDVDGDGRRELVVGVPTQGVVQIHSGFNGALLGTLSAGLGAPSRFGAAIANAGDVDHDGFDDVVIGAPRAGSAGQAFLFSTRTFARLRRWSTSQPQTTACSGSTDRYGASVCAIGDLDGDGIVEIAVGDPHWSVNAATCSAEGFVEVVDLGPAPVRVRAFLTGAGLFPSGSVPCTMSAIGPGFGFAVAGMNDLDDDGIPELVVGAPGANRAFAYSGVSLQPGATPLVTATMQGSPPHSLGTSLAQIGDLEHDGRNELAVGVPAFFTNANSTTHRYQGKHVGNSSGGPIQPMGTFGIGAPVGRCLGWSVANLGDFDLDGTEDFLAGAGSPCNSLPGAYYLFSGKTGGLLQFVIDPVSTTYGQVVHATGNVSAGNKPMFMIADPGAMKVYVK